MGSLKQSFVIDLTGFEATVPVIGEQVRVVGQDADYVVLRVDHARHVADLMPTTGTRRVEEGVSLRALSPCAIPTRKGSFRAIASERLPSGNANLER